eukprot:GHVT01102391.1.p1 GENE.GHVT01102391.1~~GHVT01102391.1.p1  ORF type:complete len:1037 (+),score=104.37 GHVT01102391.1:382-3492(+)
MAIQLGQPLLVEALGEEIDPLLEPLLSRAVVKRGRNSFAIKLGGDEIEYDTNFALILQTKLSNPHYRPEVSAQCTLVNFIVTPFGLEEQILAMVVNVEKPELEQRKQELVRKQNAFMVTLASLEDQLLEQLSKADPATILSNIGLIEGLENTKKTALEIQLQVKEAQETELKINESREAYRPVAAEGSMLYFLLIQLYVMSPMYQFSLDSFVVFLFKAIARTSLSEDVGERCHRLVVQLRLTIFTWVSRGLFERHKLVFTSLLAFRLLQRGQLADGFDQRQFQFLLRGGTRTDVPNPLSEWLPDAAWNAVQKLIDLPGFEQFASNLEKDAPTRFKEWLHDRRPELAKLPLEWKKLDSQPFQKLLVLRCLRPDRLTIALSEYIRSVLPDGASFLECDSSSSFEQILLDAFEDSSSSTPIFFVLSPGADPVKEVEKIGSKLGFTYANQNFHNIALGQGQDVLAKARLETAHKDGHWVMLQNIHLMPGWTSQLERKLENFQMEGSHPNFRCFLSSEPCNYIPVGLLDRSIKLINEPPQGLKPNLKRAFAFFPKVDFESRDSRVKGILFGLCFFHAIVLERKKFGAKGWNMDYPFSIGDLRDSATVLFNLLETQNPVKIPWPDLQYIIGEIMYGGHIVDARDRLLCRTYLEFFMRDELLDECELFPFADGQNISYKSPLAPSYEKYIEHIDALPVESPLAFGLHTNAEIGFRTAEAMKLVQTLSAMQSDFHEPQQKPDASSIDEQAAAGGADGAGNSSDETASSASEQVCHDILDEFKDTRFALEDISRSMADKERGPYQNVFLQECDLMNQLLEGMTKSLGELVQGIKGELTMSEGMEALLSEVNLDLVPMSWQLLAYPSTRPLGSWLSNLRERLQQLQEWTSDPTLIPRVTYLSRLFNPQSFLTAIKQVTAQHKQLELNKVVISTDVTKRDVKAIDAHAKEGAYVSGFYLDGARFDVTAGCLEECRPKEMFFPMPVINIKAALGGTNREDKTMFSCPVYKTLQRGRTFVFEAQLRSRQPPARWVLAGVAMILDIGQGV